MGAVAAARSTESSFTDYVTASHVPQLYVLDGVINPSIGLDSGLQPRAATHLVAPALRAACGKHGRAQHGPAHCSNHPEPNTSSISAEASVGGLGLHRGPRRHRLGSAARPHDAGRVRHRRRVGQGARLPPGPVGPRGLGEQHAGVVWQYSVERRDPAPSTGEGEARRHRRRPGDDALPGPGLGRPGHDHAVHAGADEQAARVLQQRHVERAYAARRHPPSRRRRAGSHDACSLRACLSSTSSRNRSSRPRMRPCARRPSRSRSSVGSPGWPRS